MRSSRFASAGHRGSPAVAGSFTVSALKPVIATLSMLGARQSAGSVAGCLAVPNP
jgi:hypothetical protein